MIGLTGEGWLCSMRRDPDSRWGDVEEFYECMEEYANERSKETDSIIVMSDVWGKIPKDLPKPGDGFAFYHSSRAGFPRGDKFGRKPRISAIGTLLEFVYKGKHDGKERAWIKVSVEPDVLEFLKPNPIIRHRGSPMGKLFDRCIPQGRVESFYKADAHTWKEFVSKLPAQKIGEPS